LPDFYKAPPIQLVPGRYRVFGFPPMTGLLLGKWIDVLPSNRPGCYGPADIEIATSIPNLVRIEDERGLVVWSGEDPS
jgi:hypothetical protein